MLGFKLYIKRGDAPLLVILGISLNTENTWSYMTEILSLRWSFLCSRLHELYAHQSFSVTPWHDHVGFENLEASYEERRCLRLLHWSTRDANCCKYKSFTYVSSSLPQQGNPRTFLCNLLQALAKPTHLKLADPASVRCFLTSRAYSC